jgi:hypothetical protein
MELPTPEELPYSLVLKGNPYRVEGERRYSCPRINPVIHRKLLTEFHVQCTKPSRGKYNYQRLVEKEHFLFV